MDHTFDLHPQTSDRLREYLEQTVMQISLSLLFLLVLFVPEDSFQEHFLHKLPEEKSSLTSVCFLEMYEHILHVEQTLSCSVPFQMLLLNNCSCLLKQTTNR